MHTNQPAADSGRADQLRASLAHFTGTEHWYRHPLNPRAVTFTDGAKAFAEDAGCFWLLDILATELVPLALKHGIIFTTCTVKDGKARIAANRDTGQPDVWSKDIESTDCPEGEWPLWMGDGGPYDTVVIMLPSEY